MNIMNHEAHMSFIPNKYCITQLQTQKWDLIMQQNNHNATYTPQTTLMSTAQGHCGQIPQHRAP